MDSKREAGARDGTLRNEKKVEVRDQVCMQNLRRLLEVMACEQRENSARIQQGHNDAAREMERRLPGLQVDIADISDIEPKVPELASKVKDDTRTQAEHLRGEREKREHEMVGVDKILIDAKSTRIHKWLVYETLGHRS